MDPKGDTRFQHRSLSLCVFCVLSSQNNRIHMEPMTAFRMSNTAVTAVCSDCQTTFGHGNA